MKVKTFGNIRVGVRNTLECKEKICVIKSITRCAELTTGWEYLEVFRSILQSRNIM